MKNQKLFQFLIIVALVLALLFIICLISPAGSDNVILRIALWCGLLSQIIEAITLAVMMRKNKKEEPQA